MSLVRGEIKLQLAAKFPPNKAHCAQDDEIYSAIGSDICITENRKIMGQDTTPRQSNFKTDKGELLLHKARAALFGIFRQARHGVRIAAGG